MEKLETENRFTEYSHLSAALYVRPDSYAGETHYGTATVYGHNRDDDTVRASNWAEMIARYGESEHVYITRESHWAVGWVEFMRLKPSAPDDLCQQIENDLQALENYPILNEDDLSNREFEEIGEACADYIMSEFVSATHILDDIREKYDSEIQRALSEHCEHDGHSPTIADGHFRDVLATVAELAGHGGNVAAIQELDTVHVRHVMRGKPGTWHKRDYPLDGKWEGWREYQHAFQDADGNTSEWCDYKSTAKTEARKRWPIHYITNA